MTIPESTSSTIDSDAQARDTADNELSTRFHSDLIPLLGPLYRQAMRMTRNHADAEDLLQDTMVKACTSFRSRKHNTNLGGWLFRIMTNTYTDMYRKQRRQPALYTMDFTAEVAGADHSAEDQALNLLGHSGIRTAMRALPEQ